LRAGLEAGIASGFSVRLEALAVTVAAAAAVCSFALAPEAATVANPRTVESAVADQRDAMRCMSIVLHVLAGS
jgi:hypothetical protein